MFGDNSLDGLIVSYEENLDTISVSVDTDTGPFNGDSHTNTKQNSALGVGTRFSDSRISRDLALLTRLDMDL